MPMGRPWTDDDDAMLARLYPVVGAEESAVRMGRRPREVRYRVVKLGLHGRSRRDCALEVSDETILGLYLQGMTDRQIADALGVTIDCVWRRRTRFGLPKNGRADWGAMNRSIRRRREEFALRSGWPTDLLPRQVQVLNLMASIGVPITTAQISEMIGLRCRSLRIHIRNLCDRNLAVRVGTLVEKAGRGIMRSNPTYTLGVKALEILEVQALCQKRSAQP